VKITPDALKQIGALPAGIVPRIYKLIERLAQWPEVSGVKPLRGNRTGSYRVRTGDYRMIFRVDGARVVVTKVADRRDIYED